MNRLVCLSMMVLVATGCQYDPFAHEYTHSKPTPQELVGSYGLDKDTLRSMPDHAGSIAKSAELILNSDGTFTASNLPPRWRNETVQSSISNSVGGTWAIVEHQEWWSVRLTCTKINGKAQNYVLPLMVRGDAAPRILHLTIGDPDSGEALAFERHGGTS